MYKYRLEIRYHPLPMVQANQQKVDILETEVYPVLSLALQRLAHNPDVAYLKLTTKMIGT